MSSFEGGLGWWVGRACVGGGLEILWTLCLQVFSITDVMRGVDGGYDVPTWCVLFLGVWRDNLNDEVFPGV